MNACGGAEGGNASILGDEGDGLGLASLGINRIVKVNAAGTHLSDSTQ